MGKIGGFFGRSALGPLNEQMIKVRETVEELPGLFDAVFAADAQALCASAAAIDRLEGQTDDIKDEIRNNLSRSFFSSVERSDVLSLVKVLDTIADRCSDLAKFAALRPTRIPEHLQPRIREIEQTVVKCVKSLAAAMGAIRELEERQALKHETPRIEEMLRSVALNEHLADRAEQAALEALFTCEKELDPVSVIFTLRLIEATGRVANAAENVSDGLRHLFCTR
ncbi:MAG TPA: DUF47 domain-containing protein [Planctomycetes bacterium]|nr:DUF47 domain-containing protein [Planctomycetota bacterium]